MTGAKRVRFSIEHNGGVLKITAPAPKNLWNFVTPLCSSVFVFSAAIPVAWRVILTVLNAVSIADSLRRLNTDDSVTVNADSLLVRSYWGFRFQTTVYAADEIRVLGFYPTLLGEQTSFKVAMMVKSRMIPLLYLEGPEAADVFDELNRIPWLAPKILRMECPVFFQAKERRPLKAAWSGFVALMAKPLRLPRL